MPPMHADVLDTPANDVTQAPSLTSLPILLLNVHERCNCRCIMCDIWKRESGAEIDIQSLERHQSSLSMLGTRQVVLTGGEPLLHSRLEGLCAFLKTCGVHITVLTTGLLLAKHARTVAASVDEVILSIDGPEEVHDRVRRVKRGFQLIREGVLAVRQLKPAMLIHARSTVQKANHSCLRQTVEGVKSMQVDSISFLAADLTSQAFNRELVWPGERQNEIALTRTEISALEEEIELLICSHKEDLARGYIKESAEKLRRLPRRFREHIGELTPEAPLCNAPWVSAVVEVDGSVRPCFFHRKIGSLKTTTLADVVNGDEAQEFRRTLNVAENPTCRRCVCSLHYKGAA
jgi:MoaA/NifB/PqqE/SkfB family radical SAM enzyme